MVLVLNKVDQLAVETRDEWCNHILEELQWEGPVFKTSGLTAEGRKTLYYLMDQIEQQREREVEDPEYAAEMKAFRDQLKLKHVNKRLLRKKLIVKCVALNVWVAMTLMMKMMTTAT